MDALRLCSRLSQQPTASPSDALNKLSGVRGIIFEGHGVLFDESFWRRWLLQLLTRMGLHTHYEAFFGVWDHDYADVVYAGRRELRCALVDFLTAAGLSQPQIQEIIPALRAQRKQLDCVERPIPAVAETTRKLVARGYTLGVSADAEWTLAELLEKLKRLGLHERFKCVVSSVDLGCCKPELAGYSEVISAMGLTPESTAFVGTRVDHLSGARDAGMQTIALDCEHFETATGHVDRFAQISDLLEDQAEQILHRRAG